MSIEPKSKKVQKNTVGEPPKMTLEERAKKEMKEWAGAIIWALGVFLLLFQPFVMSGYKIPSGSMEDTLLIGDFLQIDKCTYGGKIPFTDIRVPGTRKPVQGDIVAFWSLENPKIRMIKRCVAVGGQTVEVRNKQLYVNGQPVDGEYIVHKDSRVMPKDSPVGRRDNFGPFVVPEGMYFMMGDNRDNSHDSRFFGPVPFDRVIGIARFIYFSVDQENGEPIYKSIRFSRMFKRLSREKDKEPFKVSQK